MSFSLAPWTLRDRTLEWGQRTYLMGILNVTPDSFSDGGQFNSLAAALALARTFIDAGVDIIDIGGESTRPNAAKVTLEEELERVIPVIEALRTFTHTPISIDTTKSAVAAAAIEAGADIVNDVSGATSDLQMLEVVAQLQVPIILMHLRGTPQTMQQLTQYDQLVPDIVQALKGRVQAAIAAGIRQIALDPGIGFAKTGPQSIELIRQTEQFRSLGYPLLVGPSRKSFIGQILNQPDPQARVWGTAAACCGAIAGGADMLRVHDVVQMQDVVRVADAIWRNREGD